MDGYFLDRPVSRLAMSARNRVCSALIWDSSVEIDVVPDLELEAAARLSASLLNWTMAATSSFTSNTRLARILSPLTTEITLAPAGACDSGMLLTFFSAPLIIFSLPPRVRLLAEIGFRGMPD